MFPTPELARMVQQERLRHIADFRLARIAAAARACCEAPATLIDRLIRLVRPVPAAC